MHFDTFYQYFIYSKNCAYIAIILILPIFVLFWNFVLYPTKDPEVRAITGRLSAFLPKCRLCSRLHSGKKE